MEKWTIKKLNEIDDLTFAACILSERAAKLNPYSPLGERIAKVRAKLMDMAETEQMKKRG